jgi:hypothetical protein
LSLNLRVKSLDEFIWGKIGIDTANRHLKIGTPPLQALLVFPNGLYIAPREVSETRQVNPFDVPRRCNFASI